MTNHPEPSPPAKPEIDPDLLEVAQEVFDLARRGDAAMLAAVIEKGVPPNLRNDKGDSLVMLASYHGHVDAVRTLLERGADPDLRNDNGQTPIAAPRSRASTLSLKPCSRMAPTLKAPRRTVAQH